MMNEALKPLADTDVELKAKILIRRTPVEISENKYYEALNILKEAEPVFKSAGDALKGRWHGQKGPILRRLATAEERAEYFDKAISNTPPRFIITNRRGMKGTVRLTLTTSPSCSTNEGKEHYDLLISDNDLPHVSGVELIRRVRQLPHRKRTPVIMLSAGDVETEAWKAGVNAFLRKPHDIGNLTAMVKRLLSGSE
jgi:CheY-like chemotaxis protein